MSFHKTQFRNLIIRVLMLLSEDLCTDNAVDLLLGTAAKESCFGTCLRQLGKGPALGAFQIEPETFKNLQKEYSKRFPQIASRRAEELEWDIRLGIIMARLKYLSCPGNIPHTLLGQAEYWKRYYNTSLGLGTVEEYLSSYRKYIQ